MDDNKKKSAQESNNTNAKKSDRTEFADEINVDTNKNGKSTNCK